MLNKPNKWLKLEEKHLNRAKIHCNGLREPIDYVSNRLVVNQSNSKATASSSDLLFIKNKGLTNTYLSGRGHASLSWALPLASLTSEAAPCPLQPCYFAKWDMLADTSDYQYVMGFPVCICNHFLPIFRISCHRLMRE